MDCCKVGTVVEERGLAVSARDGDVHDYLVARWLGEGDYPAIGVRKLADWFNEKLLREAYTAHGRNVTDIRISSEYEVLTGDDEVARGEVVDDLASDGIDGEALVDDFVSRSTMRRHLTNCLGASKETTDESAAESTWELDRIEYSKDHLAENVGEAVRSLANKHRLPGGDEADVDVAVFLSCPECATQVRLRTALDRGYICADHLGRAPSVGVEVTGSMD